MNKLNSEQLLQHWESCQNKDDLSYNAYIQQGKIVASSYKNWELAIVDVDKILNYQNSELEFSGPLVQKINHFMMRGFRNINDLPPIILVPLDRKNPRPFVEHKYRPEVEWEPADGVHRLHLLLKLGQKTVRSYIPCEDDYETN
jgi:hypothetical protein